MPVVEQLCREKELYNIHSSYDFCLVNGKLFYTIVRDQFHNFPPKGYQNPV